MGDVLNTTARIEGECNTMEEPFLISGELLNRIDIPDNLQTIDHKVIQLRGKENKLRLFGINQKKTNSRVFLGLTRCLINKTRVSLSLTGCSINKTRGLLSLMSSSSAISLLGFNLSI